MCSEKGLDGVDACAVGVERGWTGVGVTGWMAMTEAPRSHAYRAGWPEHAPVGGRGGLFRPHAHPIGAVRLELSPSEGVTVRRSGWRETRLRAMLRAPCSSSSSAHRRERGGTPLLFFPRRARTWTPAAFA